MKNEKFNNLKIHYWVQNKIKEALGNLEINQEVDFSIEHSEDLKNGDYSTNVAMVYAKELKTNPKDLAEKIVEFLRSDLKNIKRSDLGELISEIQIAGPGFINFYLSREFFINSIKEILEQNENWGKNEKGKGEKVIVEYSSPNIAKPFTIGHLRSTIIGDSLARIMIFSGCKVIKDNHLGDWGTQFGKLIVAINRWGNLEKIKKSDEPIKELVALYVKFHSEAEKDDKLEEEARAYFLKLENKDEEVINIWKTCVEISKKEFNKIYKKLNILEFDTEYGESFFEDKMKDIISDIKEKNLGKESQGAFIIEFEEKDKLPPLLLLKKDGSSLYALRDLATDKWRKKEYGDDIKIINEVGGEQMQYFRQIFKAEEMLGYFKKDQRKHVFHGLYRFKDGKMSTRAGNVIWLEDIIKEAEDRAGEINEESKEKVAIGSLKFNDLKRDAKKDIIFDWEEILNIKGDSGAYLQYSSVRAKSILEKSKVFLRSDLGEMPYPEEIPMGITDLEKLLYRFPEVIEYSYQKLEPHHIATFLTELASEFNTFYANTQILPKEDLEGKNTSYRAGNKYMEYHLKLTEAFYITMKNGLYLLGIEIPERM